MLSPGFHRKSLLSTICPHPAIPAFFFCCLPSARQFAVSSQMPPEPKSRRRSGPYQQRQSR